MAARCAPAAGVNCERLYAYRSCGVDQASRQAVWQEIARNAHARTGALGQLGADRGPDPYAGIGSHACLIRTAPARR
jgi:hypothetical protein